MIDQRECEHKAWRPLISRVRNGYLFQSQCANCGRLNHPNDWTVTVRSAKKTTREAR